MRVETKAMQKEMDSLGKAMSAMHAHPRQQMGEMETRLRGEMGDMEARHLTAIKARKSA